MKHIFIINPVAGKTKEKSGIISKINEYFSGRNDYQIFVTEYPGQASEIAKKQAQSGEEIRIYAGGGEGTVFEVLNGVFGYENVSLGVVPCGSANDYLKFYGEKEIFTDIEQLEKGETLEVDVIKADEYYCLNQCAAGMDAIVADRMKKFKRIPFVSGSMAYKLAIIKLLLGKLGLTLKITVDNGASRLKDCLFAVCASGPVYGGGYICAPNASPLDGILDYTIIDTISKLKVPSFLKAYEKGGQGKFDYCEMGNCSSMEIEADKEFPVTLDGEIIYKKKVRFEIIKKGIKFIVPQKIAIKFKQKRL